MRSIVYLLLLITLGTSYAQKNSCNSNKAETILVLKNMIDREVSPDVIITTYILKFDNCFSKYIYSIDRTDKNVLSITLDPILSNDDDILERLEVIRGIGIKIEIRYGYVRSF